MSLQTQLANLITSLGTDYKALRAVIGTLTSLSTTEKGSVVGAINEVKAIADAAGGGGGGGATIDDSTPTSVTTYSSSKIVALLAVKAVIDDTTAALSTVYSSTKVNSQIAALIDDASSLTTKVFSASKVNSLVNAKPSVNDTTPSASNTYSSNKINSAIAALIADGVTASGTTWSSTKINSVVNAAVAGVVASAPGTLDTLNELATALGNDANFATTITEALGNRVRVDTNAQGLNSTQQGNARTNIGAVAAADIGNPDADLVALYTAAKA